MPTDREIAFDESFGAMRQIVSAKIGRGESSVLCSVADVSALLDELQARYNAGYDQAMRDRDALEREGW